jgi:hypothetical protein
VNRHKVFFATYPRTAVVFAVIVTHTDNKTSSVYVSSATYGCRFDKKAKPEQDCYAGVDTTEVVSVSSIYFFIVSKRKGPCIHFFCLQVLSIFAITTGIFLMFLSHRMFKSSIFLVAFFGGGIVGYVLLMNSAARPHLDHLSVCLLLGAVCTKIYFVIF